MHAVSIVPTPFLGYCEEESMHMALAHLIGKNKAYTNFYKEQAAKGKYIIMDTGLIEGDERPLEEVVQKALEIGASEIVIPDVFNNGDESFEVTKKALRQFEQMETGDLRVMVVCHGQTWTEFLECLNKLAMLPFDTLGLPKVMVKNMGTTARLACISYIEENVMFQDKDIHLLGCWDSPLETLMIETEHPGRVRSCDSAIAFAFTLNDEHFTTGDRFRGKIDFDHAVVDKQLLQQNLEDWRNLCKGLPILNGGKVYELY